VESGVWEAYEDWTWAQKCPIICRLGWHSPQPQKGARARCSTAGFPDMLIFREQRLQAPPVPNSCNVTPTKNYCSTSLFATVYNKLTGGRQGGCMSPSECPPDPSFLHVCLLPFLNLPSLPVRFLGWACAGCKRIWGNETEMRTFLCCLQVLLIEESSDNFRPQGKSRTSLVRAEREGLTRDSQWIEVPESLSSASAD
jgi:hypothetical protein